MAFLKVLLSILVPPLGVYLTVGLGMAFWTNLLLTCLGWVPGSIHALWIWSKTNETQRHQGTT